MSKPNEKILKACEAARDKMVALGIESELVSEINWCLGSYAHDHNPDGLYQKGAIALDALKGFKKSNPRKVAQKLIDDLAKAVN